MAVVGEGGAGSGEARGVLKLKSHSHHQVDRWEMSRAGHRLKGCHIVLVQLPDTSLRNLSKWSREWEVTPHCSIQPLYF